VVAAAVSAVTARVAVLSSTEFGRRCIEEALLNTPSCTLAGILTTGPEIAISYAPQPIRIATHVRFDAVARRAGCPVIALSSRPTTAAYLEVLRGWQAELILVLGWYYLVPKRVRETARLGCLGIHASLLPKYRGGAPIAWAMINGDTMTGVTLFHLEDEVDAGDIVAQRVVPIGPLETCADVMARATDASVEMLADILPLLVAATAPRTPQASDLATVMPQRSADDGIIDWSGGVTAVHNFIRAQTRPYPGAFTWAGGTRLTIWLAVPAATADDTPPGTVAMAPEHDALLVSCGDGQLRVTEVGLPDGRTMAGRQLAAELMPALSGRWGHDA
jgi:methionyl-tRNA formyltransferase